MLEKRKREGNCFGCNKPKQITNRTKWLCNDCNQVRLSDTKIKSEDTKKICKRCNQPKPIVNNTHCLCDECNYFRLHKESREETQRKKNQIQRIKPVIEKEQHPNNSLRYYKNRRVRVIEKDNLYTIEIIKTGERIKAKSTELERNKPLEKRKNKEVETNSKQRKKEREIKATLSQVKKQIENDNLENDTYYCRGCGTSYYGLDKSHILSVRYRKDLETEYNNMNLMCRECHIIWESGEIEKQIKLDCFEKDLRYIYEKDRVKFMEFIYELERLLTLPIEIEIEEKVRRVLGYYKGEGVV